MIQSQMMLQQAGAATNFVPMGQHVAIKTLDLDELEEFINAGFMERRSLAYLGRKRSLNAHISNYNLPQIQLIGVHLGSNILATSAPLQVTQILIPIYGRLLDRTGNNRETMVTPGSAIVHNESEPVHVKWEPNTSCLSIRIPDTYLKQIYHSLCGDMPPHCFRFHPVLDLTCGPGQSLMNIIYGLLNEIEINSGLLKNTRVAKLYETLLVTAFFRMQPQLINNPALVRETPIPIYYYVKRATEFMMANLNQQLSTEDLVTVTGVSQRTLQTGFKKCFGVGPIGYLRRERLKQVHAELSAASPAETCVGSVAARWGFYHSSHFSTQYRMQFGEPPSVTLART